MSQPALPSRAGKCCWSQGRTVFRVDEKGEQKGGQLLWILFESADERYLWLNDALCLIEGVIDALTMRIKFKVYACLNELIQ